MMKRVYISVILLLFLSTLKGQSGYDLVLRAKALCETGEPGRAIELLSAATGSASDSRLLLSLGEAYMLEGDYPGAIDAFTRANKITMHSGDYGLARVYSLKGIAATSLYHLGQSMESSFRKSEKEILTDPAFGRIEQSAEWRLFWKKEWYSPAGRKISELEYYVKAGNAGEAENIATLLGNEYPGSQDAIYASALVNKLKGKTSEVVRLLTGLNESEPGNAIYLRALAEAKSEASNPAGASESYTRLIEMEIPDAGLFLLRADCFIRTGEYVKALSDIRRYLDYYPGNLKALRMAGKAESASGNNLKALEYFSENLRLHPGDPDCYTDRGDSYFLSKSWQWAINDYSMSLDLDPGDSEVWLSKGISLLNSGKTEDACHDFRRAFALGNKRATEYISRYCIK